MSGVRLGVCAGNGRTGLGCVHLYLGGFGCPDPRGDGALQALPRLPNLRCRAVWPKAWRVLASRRMLSFQGRRDPKALRNSSASCADDEGVDYPLSPAAQRRRHHGRRKGSVQTLTRQSTPKLGRQSPQDLVSAHEHLIIARTGRVLSAISALPPRKAEFLTAIHRRLLPFPHEDLLLVYAKACWPCRHRHQPWRAQRLGHLPTYRALTPGPWFKSCSSPALYAERYFAEILGRLDPHQVVLALQRLAGGDEPVLVCSEHPPPAAAWCHRALVSAWLSDHPRPRRPRARPRTPRPRLAAPPAAPVPQFYGRRSSPTARFALRAYYRHPLGSRPSRRTPRPNGNRPPPVHSPDEIWRPWRPWYRQG